MDRSVAGLAASTVRLVELVLSVGGEGEIEAHVVVNYADEALIQPPERLRAVVAARGGWLVAGWASALPIRSGSIRRVHVRKLPVRLDRTWDGAHVDATLVELVRVLGPGGTLWWHRSNATEATARQDAATLARSA